MGFSCLPATKFFYFDWLMAAKRNLQISQNEVDHCFFKLTSKERVVRVVLQDVMRLLQPGPGSSKDG